MKKATSLILILLIFCTFAISVNAEEFNGADLFTVDLPEGFEQTGTNVTDFSFSNKEGDTFAISYADNTVEDEVFSPADMSKKEIEEYTNGLSAEAEGVMKDYVDGFKIEFLKSEKAKHKDRKTVLVCETKTTITNNKKDIVYYQTMCEFGGEKYKYTFTYTTADEKKKDSFKDVFDSIDIFEEETETNLDVLKNYALGGVVVLLIFAGIVRFIRTPEKREKGKLK